MSTGVQGGYAHKLDGKGRMVLPAKIREVVGTKVVATIGIGKWRCVYVYPIDKWEEYRTRLEEASTKGGTAKDIRRIIMASAHELDVDSLGRILLPAQLRSYAAISSEVNVIGNIDHLEIWDMENWNAYQQAAFEEAVKNADDIEGI